MLAGLADEVNASELNELYNLVEVQEALSAGNFFLVRRCGHSPSAPGAAASACGQSLCLGAAELVPDVGAADPEDDVFGDVGSVIADALQVTGHDDRVQRLLG